MESKYTSVEEQVEFAAGQIAPDRKVEVNLRDLMYVFQTIGELNRFFHQPLHYPNIEAVHKFLGNKDTGAFHLIWECYYKKFRDVWPADVAEALGEGSLDHPESPYYFEPSSDET